MRMPQTLGAIAVAAAIAGIGGAAVYAATATPARGWGGGPHEGPPGMHGITDHTPTPVHSESVFPGPDGGFSTELTQIGQVTALTPESVTVLSADGYRQTYRLAIAGLQTGIVPLAIDAHVQIRGTRTGPVATATSIGAAGADQPTGSAVSVPVG